MRLRWHLRLLPALFLLALAAPVRAQSSPGFAWWRDPHVQKDLGLTADQSNRVDAVFRAALPHLRQRKTELDAQEAELSRLIQADADEAAIGRQSDHVEAIRAELNKSRTLMLVHMRQLLTPDQRVKLTALHKQREQQREQDNRDHRPSRRDGSR
jgi:Spy/CpxP family protein refolding chaperone